MDTGQDLYDLPIEVEQHLERADTYEEHDEFEKALLECDLALQLAPDCAEAHNLRGIVLERLDRKEEAIAAYRKAIRLDPTLEEARENLLAAETELEKGGLVDAGRDLVDAAMATPAIEGKTFGIRAGAQIIDSIVLFACMYAINLCFGALLATSGRQILLNAQRFVPQLCFLSIGSIAVNVLYFVLFEWLFGASPGKLFLRMRVVQEDGSPCTLRAAVVRDLMRYIDGFFFALPAYYTMKESPLQQRWGDKAAKTIVVDARDPIIQRPRPWQRFLAATMLSLVLTTVILGATRYITSQPVSFTNRTAALINLQASDLGASYSLDQESGRELWTEDSLGDDLQDGNQRLFISEDTGIQSTVLVFRFYLIDTKSDLRSIVERDVSYMFEGQTLVFDPALDLTFCETGIMSRFYDHLAGTEGYALFLVEQNVFVRLIAYGSPDKITADQVQALARLMYDRISSD